MIAPGELLIRLVVGTTLGGIIGYERDIHGRPAGLWLVAAIGLASGAGMYVLSAAATLVGVVALAVLRRFEHKDDQLRRKISLILTDSGPTASGILRRSVWSTCSSRSPASSACGSSRSHDRGAPRAEREI